MSYRIGVYVAKMIPDTDPEGIAALMLRNHRTGFERPVTPNSLATDIEDAKVWLAKEVEEGRDFTIEDLEDARAQFLHRAPSAAAVPSVPSRS